MQLKHSHADNFAGIIDYLISQLLEPDNLFLQFVESVLLAQKLLNELLRLKWCDFT